MGKERVGWEEGGVGVLRWVEDGAVWRKPGTGGPTALEASEDPGWRSPCPVPVGSLEVPLRDPDPVLA